MANPSAIAEPIAEVAPVRRLVFISHANNEDNEFASWLGTRLIAAGYEVWADIFRLVGGEAFWRDIGVAIKDEAAAVIAVVSKASYQKDGVLDEIAMAVATGRKLQKPSFVIPVRLDDVAFADFPEQIVRLNAIDFASNWADGLSRVQEALEKAGVPRSTSSEAAAFDQWREFRLRQSGTVAHSPEQLASNWLAILELPSEINFCRFGSDPKTITPVLAKFTTPIVQRDRLGLTFSDAASIVIDETPSIGAEHAYTLNLEAFLDGKRQEGPEVRKGDASNMVTNLLRQAWESFAKSRGLVPYEFSNSTGWFVPRDLIAGNKASYIDGAGKSRWKLLVGRSEKRQVYWHFAVTAYASLGEFPHFVLRPQIVFTIDGKTPLDSKSRAANLRRSFCKNWWNDRWLGLLSAFVSFLAEGNAEIDLPLGGDKTAKIAGRLLAFESSLSIVGDSIAAAEDEIAPDSETEADELDDGEDFVPHDELEEDVP